MGDFYQPFLGAPEVPADPPTPPPNFEGIGQSIWAGAAKAGATSGWLQPLFDILMRWLTAGLGWALASVVRIFAWLIAQLTNVEADAGAAYGQFVSNTINNLFNVRIDPSVLATRAGGSTKQAAANAMAQSILGGLYPTIIPSPTGGIPPSSTAVNSFIGTTMNMELQGWLDSFIADGLSYHLLEKYGDLKDGISRTLGLGRLAHQALSPPMKLFVHDPYEAALNQSYRPKAVEPAAAIRAFYSKLVDRTWLETQLGNQGYTSQQIDFLIADHDKTFGIGDIDYMLRRSIWSDLTATTYLQNLGWDTAAAQQMVALLNDKRTQKYRDQMATIARDRFLSGDMDEGTFVSVIGTLGYTQDEQQWMHNVASFERSTKLTHLSEGQIETGIIDGVLNLGDLEAWAQRVNMPLTEEAELELEILIKQNAKSATAKAKAAAASAKATAAQAKAAAASAKAAQAKAEAADFGLSAAQAELLVEEGAWTFDQLTAFLTAKGYGPDAIASIVTLVSNKLAAAGAKATAAAGVKASAAAKGLNLAEVQKAVADQILQISDLQSWLTSHGYDKADTSVIVVMAQEALRAATIKAQTKAAAAAKAADKGASLADLEKAVRLGLTSQDTYNAALQAAGYDSAAVAILDGLLTAQIASDQAAAAKKATLAAASGQKAASLPQLEQEIVSGIRGISDYPAALAKLGYSPADQQQLTQLLQLKVDGAKATAAKKAAAAAALLARGISLTQAETAVKLGVVPITTYQAMLKAAGFTPDAVDTLTSSLLAEVAKAAKAQQAANAAAGTLASKSISLPDLERAVIAGLQPIANYAMTLTANGYSSADTATLTQLLQLKVDQAARAKAAHADAEGVATQRGISLATEEKAVVDGDLTMDDYDALLTSLGYDAIDRATLEQLLQEKMGATST